MTREQAAPSKAFGLCLGSRTLALAQSSECRTLGRGRAGFASAALRELAEAGRELLLLPEPQRRAQTIIPDGNNTLALLMAKPLPDDRAQARMNRASRCC